MCKVVLCPPCGTPLCFPPTPDSKGMGTCSRLDTPLPRALTLESNTKMKRCYSWWCAVLALHPCSSSRPPCLVTVLSSTAACSCYTLSGSKDGVSALPVHLHLWAEQKPGPSIPTAPRSQETTSKGNMAMAGDSGRGTHMQEQYRTG